MTTWRNEWFEFEDATYLNAAGQGPLPKVSLRAAQQAIAQLEEAARLAAEDPQIAVRTGDVTAAAEGFAKLGLTDPVLSGELITAELGDCQPEKLTAELVHAGVGVRGLLG